MTVSTVKRRLPGAGLPRARFVLNRLPAEVQRDAAYLSVALRRGYLAVFIVYHACIVTCLQISKALSGYLLLLFMDKYRYELERVP